MKKLGILAVILILGMGSLQTEAQETREETEMMEAAETEAAEEKLPILFFHNTACGSCDGTADFVAAVQEEISYYKEAYPYELQCYNVFQTTGKQEWEKTEEMYGLKNEEYIYPVMVLDRKMYRGMEEIKENLQEAFLEACDISAVYFYRKDCPECQDMEGFWENFPEEYKIAELESRTGENGELIQNLFEKYQVPDEDQMVPFVFLKDTYLAGEEAIEAKLQNMLEEGKYSFYNK